MDKERLKIIYEKISGLREKFEEEYGYKTWCAYDHIVRNLYLPIDGVYYLVIKRGREFSEDMQRGVKESARKISRYIILLKKFPEFRKAELDPEGNNYFCSEVRAINHGENYVQNYVDYAWSRLMGDKGKK